MTSTDKTGRHLILEAGDWQTTAKCFCMTWAKNGFHILKACKKEEEEEEKTEKEGKETTAETTKSIHNTLA